MTNVTITQFDRDNLPVVRKRVQDALDEIGKTMGITLKMGNITYTPDGSSFSVKLEAKTAGAPDAERERAIRLGKMYGFDATEPSTSAIPQLKGIRLIGYRPKAGKRPWVCLSPDGREYVYPDSSMKMAFPAA